MSRYQDFDFGSGGTQFEADDIGQFVYGNQSTAMDDTLGFDAADELASSKDLSANQEIVLILFQILSSVLSLIGSSLIVFKILRIINRNKSSTPYDRIILGLSSCDIVSSITYAVSPFLLPSATSTRVWALGNDTTCSWIGFLSQLACFWSIWYNCILSFYYLLTVRFQVKRKDFTRKYELWLHLSGAIFFPLTSVIGLFGDWYSEMRYAMMCWIGEVPKGCKNCYGVPVAYTFGAAPTIITLISVITNNIIIYIFVRRKLSPAPPTESEMFDIENMASTRRLNTQQNLRKEAAMQGFLYVTTFLLTFLPGFAIQVIEGMVLLGEENLQQMYPLLVMNAILLPLQGFFNVFIYIRPTYNRFRAAKPDESMFVILRQSLFDPNIPRISSVANNTERDKTGGKEEYPEMKKRAGSKGSKGSQFSMSLDNIQEDAENESIDEIIGNDTSYTKPHSTESFKIIRKK